MAQAPNNFRQSLSIMAPLAVITIALASSAISNGINIYKSGVDANLDDKQASTVFAMFGSVFLSIFIIIGLYGSNRQSRTLRNEILAIDSYELQAAETSFGSASRSDLKGAIGLLLSLASITVNMIEGTQTTLVNYNGNSQAITREWLIGVQLISFIANLYGFITLDRLGARNHNLVEFLHRQQIRKKDTDIAAINRTLETSQTNLNNTEATLTDTQNRLALAQTALTMRDATITELGNVNNGLLAEITRLRLLLPPEAAVPDLAIEAEI